MHTHVLSRRTANLLRATCLVMSLLAPSIQAFPPAPPHHLFGTVRDPIGHPLPDGAEVILEAASGVKIRSFVLAQDEPGVNYRLEVPMDAGLTSDRYTPTALMPTAPFKIRVVVGRISYLPMEMAGDPSKLGAPGGRTRMDLTLGIDADGNGLPDGWEKAVSSFLGHPWIQGGIRPDAPYPGSNMIYRDVYLAGTYAIEPKEGFALQINVGSGPRPTLAFTSVKGRSYSVQVATELGQWTTVPFRVPPFAPDSAPVEAYWAADTRRVEIEAPDLSGVSARFYRLLVW